MPQERTAVAGGAETDAAGGAGEKKATLYRPVSRCRLLSVTVRYWQGGRCRVELPGGGVITLTECRVYAFSTAKHLDDQEQHGKQYVVLNPNPANDRIAFRVAARETSHPPLCR